MLRLRTLGECAIESDDSRIGPDADVLFATGLYLAIERGRRVARAELLELIWPAADGRSGRHCLRQALYRLRQSGAGLDSTTTHVMLPASEVELDFGVFLSSTTAERVLLDEDRCREFLPGYAPDFSAPFGEWVEEQRAFVHGQIRRVLVGRLGELRARGDWGRLDGVARACLRFDPLNEEATLARAEAAAMTGSKREAVEILDRYMAELGPGATEIRLPASVLRKRISEHLPTARIVTPSESPFVGREDELAMLAHRISRARSGEGGAFTILGDAGIGKTRLLDEATVAASLHGIRTHRAACQQHDMQRPLSVFADLVPALLKLSGAIGCSPETLEMLGRLTDLRNDLSAPAPEGADVRLVAAKVRQSLLDLFDAVSEERCVVVILDDAQWLDSESEKLLREMIVWSASRKVLFIIGERTQHSQFHQSTWRSHVGLVMQPLVQASARVLVVSLLAAHGREADEHFLTWCLAVAEGNPFFLRELTLHWIATRDISQVPSTVQVILESRISRIGQGPLRVLEAAAILGKLSTFQRVQDLLGYPTHEMVSALAKLEEEGLVKCFGELVECRHELVGEATLKHLTPGARRFLHRAAAEKLEAEIALRPVTALLWDCARHWRSAEEDSKVVRVTLSCARHLVAIGMVNAALEVLESAQELKLDHSDQVELEKMRMAACLFGSRWDGALVASERLETLRRDSRQVEALHSDEELVRLEASWFAQVDSERVLPRLFECATSFSSTSLHRLKSAGIALIAADYLADQAAAASLYASTVSIQAVTVDDQLAKLRVELIYHSTFGDLTRAVVAASDLLSLHRLHGNPAMLRRVLAWTCIPLRRVGDFRNAQRNLIESLALSQDVGSETTACYCCIQLTSICFESSNFTEVEAWHEKARAFLHSSAGALQALFSLNDACMALYRGDVDAAEVALRPAVAANQATSSDVRSEAHVIATLLEIALLRRDAVGVRDLVAKGLELHARLRECGDQDLLTIALTKGLCGLSQPERANSLVSDYLANYRRERSPLPYQWGTLSGCGLTLSRQKNRS